MNTLIEKCKKSHGSMEQTPEQLAQWYLNQAMDFEKSKTQQANESKVLAWRCFTASMALTLVTIITSAILIFINKPNPPAVMRVNEISGDVTMLKTLADGKLSYGGGILRFVSPAHTLK